MKLVFANADGEVVYDTGEITSNLPEIFRQAHYEVVNFLKNNASMLPAWNEVFHFDDSGKKSIYAYKDCPLLFKHLLSELESVQEELAAPAA